MRKDIKIIADRQCYIYDCGSTDVLLFQPVDDHDIEVLDSEVSEICKLATGKGFTLAAFKVGDWNDDLSPWEAPPVFGEQGFAGGAESTLKYVVEELIPELAGDRKPAIYIGGYSLAAFFALWAAYQQPLFAAVAAASPSVWIRGWVPFVQSHALLTPNVYLSLGIKEEKTRNSALARVGDNIRVYHDLLTRSLGEEHTALIWHNGGHFTECTLRLAQALAWCISKQQTI